MVGTARPPGLVEAAPRLGGSLRLAADKSVAHRALLFNAMAAGEAEVRLWRAGGDVRSMVGALRALGAVTGVSDDADGLTRVRLKPVLMMGGYGQFTYHFNYWGPTGVNRDTSVRVRRLARAEF